MHLIQPCPYLLKKISNCLNARFRIEDIVLVVKTAEIRRVPLLQLLRFQISSTLWKLEQPYA